MKNSPSTTKLYYLNWDYALKKITKIYDQYPINKTKKNEDLDKILADFDIENVKVLKIIKGIKNCSIICKIKNGNKSYSYDLLIYITVLQDLSVMEQYVKYFNLEQNVLKNLSEIDAKHQFTDFAKLLFEPINKKIVFIGFPNSGKTSVKLFYFEKVQELKLTKEELVPTSGFESQRYELMALNIALFDTSGQEIENWFTNTDLLLLETNVIIFFFSVENWQNQPEKVQEDLQRLKSVVDTSNHSIKIEIFCHKIDLITENLPTIKKSILDFLDSLNFPVFFTSIKKGGNFDLLNSFYFLFEQFSILLNLLKNDINSIAKEYGLSPLFILDKENCFYAHFDIDNYYTDEIALLRDYIPKQLELMKVSFQKMPQINAFWMTDDLNIILLINLKKFHPDFSFLILRAGDFQNIEHLRIKLMELELI